MSGGLVAAFWGVSMLFVLTPGVDWAYAISSGLRRGTVPAVCGMLTGHLTATAIVAAGVAAVLAASSGAMTVLTLAGALYLVWLGIGALRHPAAPDLDGQSAPVSRRRLFTKGIGISLLNPKVFLLFLALLPQFVSQRAGLPVSAQMLMLGVIHVANCALIYFAVSHGAARVLSHHPNVAKVVGMISGVVMIVLGILLAVERLTGHA